MLKHFPWLAFGCCVLCVGCFPDRRSGASGPTPRDARSGETHWDAGYSQRCSIWDGGADFDWFSPVPDGRVNDGETLKAVVLAREKIKNLGAVQVEETEGAIALRFEAREGKTLVVEPLAELRGPSQASVLFGPRCFSVKNGQSKVAATLSGQLMTCSTNPGVRATLVGQKAGSGCQSAPLKGGGHSFVVYGCGSYTEPLAEVSFEVPAP